MTDLLGVAWENIVVGLLSGLLVFLMSYVTKRVREKMLERKYPIAGEFLTEFEDEEQGVIVKRTAPALIKQRGNKIMGETRLTNEERVWVLEGQIAEGGHIHGIYYAKDPHDHGIGNFFLYINHGRVLEGLWSGYDSVNQKINSGRYIFRPVAKGVQVRPLMEEDVPSIIAIADDELGKDYVTIDRLKSLLDVAPTRKHFCSVAVLPDQSIAGFCIYSVMTPEELTGIMKVPPEDIPKALLHSPRIGMIETAAIRRIHQRRGVGHRLVTGAVEDLMREQVGVICAIGWRSKAGVNIGGILSNLRFQALRQYSRYWEEDSVKNNYHCPDCGKPPCTCSAVLFARFR
jgi:ribosomal protein S18 acetylase RimI-like enzyme